jgi:hypothetical protein
LHYRLPRFSEKLNTKKKHTKRGIHKLSKRKWQGVRRQKSKRKEMRETDGFFYSHHRHPKTIHLHTGDDEHIIFHADKSKKWLRILIKFWNAEVLQRGNRASFTHPVAIETITTNIEHESQRESKNQPPTKLQQRDWFSHSPFQQTWRELNWCISLTAYFN